MRFLATTAALAFLGLATPALADRALIVGIDVYREAQLTFQVPGASQADSERIHKLLTGTLGYKEADIRILRNEQATKAAILDGLENWLSEAKPGERVFFYYVGHGFFTKDLNGDEDDGKDETIVPYDALINRTVTPVAVDNMLLDDELGAAFDKLKGRTITAVIDSCHSGTVTRSLGNLAPNMAARTPQLQGTTRAIEVEPALAEEKAAGPAPDKVSKDVDLTTWTAVSPTQLALINEDAAPNYHGVFTAAFADGLEKGLADKNGNGVISNQELLDYVREQSEAYCKKKPGRCEMGLTPTLDGVDAALKVAAANPVKPPAEPVKEGEAINTGKVTPDKILDILGATLSESVTVEYLPHSPIPLGTKDIKFRVTSSMDGYLILLSVSDEGEVVQLFPNKLSDARAKDGRILANSPIMVPDAYYGIRFDATSVTKGTVIALVAVDPLKLSRDFVTRAIDVIPADEVNTKVLPELAASLATPANKEDIQQNTKPVGRSVATLRYEIVP